MNKWLFWGVIALVAFWVWKIHEGKKKRQAPREDKPATTQEPTIALVLSCAHCGLHLPKDDALEKNGKWYCSRAHVSAGPRK